MAKRTSRIAPSTIAADRAALKALAYLIDYQPTNPAYSREALLALDEQLTQDEIAEIQLEENFAYARNARNQGREARMGSSLLMHEGVLGFKDQVIAQYGPDSYAVELVGLVRKSARRHPSRKKAAE